MALLPIALASGGCNPTTDTPAASAISLAASAQRDPWPAAGPRGVALTTSHYRIFTTVERPALMAALPGFMEAAHQSYLALTGLSDVPSAAPLPIYMFATRPEWAGLTGQIVKENLDVYLQIGAGGYCYKGVCVFWDVGGTGTLSVAAHEGLHQFFASRLRDRLPMWLEEGTAATMEGFDLQSHSVTFTPQRNLGRITILRAAIVNNRMVELSKLLAMDAGDAISSSHPDDGISYYAQLWALNMFIRSDPQYRQGLTRLMADAEAGKLFKTVQITRDDMARVGGNGRTYNKVISEPVFRKYICEDLPTFQRQYLAFAKNLAQLK